MFARFFSNESLDLIEINDPYIKARHQVKSISYLV